jgi:hypothetical protein
MVNFRSPGRLTELRLAPKCQNVVPRSFCFLSFDPLGHLLIYFPYLSALGSTHEGQGEDNCDYHTDDDADDDADGAARLDSTGRRE